MGRRVSYRCDISGSVKPAEDPDVDEDDAGFDLPSGWVEIVVRRLVPSPAYAEARTQRDALVDDQTTLALAQQPDAPATDVRQRVAAMLPMPDIATHIVDERVFVVSADHVSDAIGGGLVEAL